jgi:hypothetical protein
MFYNKNVARGAGCGLTLLWCSTVIPVTYSAELTPQLQKGFDRYIQLTEERQARELNPQHFLYGNPTAEQRTKLRNGELLILRQKTLDQGKEIVVPGGLLQDWAGLLFIPHATIPQVRAILQDYAAYKQFYKPEVIESKLLGHKGNEFDIFLRLYKLQFVTVVLNGNYHVAFGDLDAKHMYVNSRSTHMGQVKNPSKPDAGEFPAGHDDGFLWALNSYWRFEQADGGVYAQLEAVSLSRDLPFGLGWLKGFLQKFPVESMQNTLKGTKLAVESGKR